MAAITSFRDIRVWQYAMQLAVDTYGLAGNLPPTEKPGLATDLQQTAAAIPTLIAAGHKSGSRAQMVTACRQAAVTAGKLETLLIITGQIYPSVPSNDIVDMVDEIQQILHNVVQRLSATPPAKQQRKTV